MYTVQFSGVLLRRYNRNYVQNGVRLASFFGRYENYGKFRECRKRIGLWLKEQGAEVAKACTRQFEFIAAQRVRRSLQIFHLYTRMWDEAALKEFMKYWRNRALRNTRQFLLSSIGVTMYNWDRERISEQELNSCKREIEGIYKLKDATVVCPRCHLRIIVDMQQPGVKYCTCKDNKLYATENEDPDGWKPYIEREDMLVWRREEPNSGGLYAYKVYGSFADVTADDFLQAQIDVEYRKEWDTTARELQIIDTDPRSRTSIDDSTDVIYWESIWPSLFSNRDYVYQRRWVVDKEKRLIIIMSKVTEHPSAPTKSGVHRVTTYWSYMVIRPYTEFHQPGIEFGLTYFDDPGVNIPSAITAWVAMKGLPNYLLQMREASKNYQAYKITKGVLDAPNISDVSLRDEDEAEDPIVDSDTHDSEESATPTEKLVEEYDVPEERKPRKFREEYSNANDYDNKESPTILTEEDRDSILHWDVIPATETQENPKYFERLGEIVKDSFTNFPSETILS